MTVLKLLALLGHTVYVYIKIRNYIIVVDDNVLAPPHSGPKKWQQVGKNKYVRI